MKLPTHNKKLHTSSLKTTIHVIHVSQDFPLLSFLSGHPDMTYLSLLIIIIVFLFSLAFPVDLAIIDII